MSWHWRPSTGGLLCIRVGFGFPLVRLAFIGFNSPESCLSTESAVCDSFPLLSEWTVSASPSFWPFTISVDALVLAFSFRSALPPPSIVPPAYSIGSGCSSLVPVPLQSIVLPIGDFLLGVLSSHSTSSTDSNWACLTDPTLPLKFGKWRWCTPSMPEICAACHDQEVWLRCRPHVNQSDHNVVPLHQRELNHA